ncbi:OmpA family protein, partial [Oleiphilus sp. HI0067]
VQNPSAKIVLEGHCDERGTKEYNIALGERRANSVAQFLKVNGVSASQIEVVSYGEESPAVAGSNETAWSKNRRVVLQY